MRVASYENSTREAVEKFLKRKGQAMMSEIIRLGGQKRVINWETAKLIIKALRVEGKVSSSRIGSRVILYKWVGG